MIPKMMEKGIPGEAIFELVAGVQRASARVRQRWKQHDAPGR